MAADQTGDRGRPIFLGTGASADAEDLTLLGKLATDIGTRRVGTTDERNALETMYRFEGLLFEDTTEGATYRWTSGGWRLWSTPLVAWTPRLAVAGLNVGAGGAIVGEYAVSAGRLYGSLRGRFSGAGVAWGDIRFTPPLPIRSPYALSPHGIGVAMVNDANGGLYQSPFAVVPGATADQTTLRIARPGDAGNTATWASSQPFQPATGDSFAGEFTYPIQY